jgi:predicted lipid-binding transport protein (Tim44 family)
MIIYEQTRTEQIVEHLVDAGNRVSRPMLIGWGLAGAGLGAMAGGLLFGLVGGLIGLPIGLLVGLALGRRWVALATALVEWCAQMLIAQDALIAAGPERATGGRTVGDG